MFPVERKNFILKYMEENNSVTVEELAELLKVTPMTIRRDLKGLEDTNKITRTFGGAVINSSLISEIPYSDKRVSNVLEKERIGKTAGSLVKEGEIVILDAGTTNMEVAKNIRDIKDLTIISTDINIICYLCNCPNVKVICTGGIIQNSTGAFIGNKAAEFLSDINADIAFIGTNAIDTLRGISTPTFEKAQVKKQILKCSEKSVLITDSSKFGKVSFAKVCDINDVNLIITDTNLNERWTNKIKKLNKNLMLV